MICARYARIGSGSAREYMGTETGLAYPPSTSWSSGRLSLRRVAEYLGEVVLHSLVRSGVFASGNAVIHHRDSYSPYQSKFRNEFWVFGFFVSGDLARWICL